MKKLYSIMALMLIFGMLFSTIVIARPVDIPSNNPNNSDYNEVENNTYNINNGKFAESNIKSIIKSDIKLDDILDLPKSEIKKLERFSDTQAVKFVKVNVKDVIQKKENSNDKINEIKNNYQISLNEFNQLEEQLQNKIESIEDKGFSIKNIFSIFRGSKSSQTTDNLANKVSLSMESNISELNQYELKLENADTKEEIKNLNEDLKQYWKNKTEQIKEQIKEENQVQLNSVIVRMNVLENKITKLQDKILAEYNQIPQELEDASNEFSNLILQAKELDSQDLINQKLKEANDLLIKEILPIVKEYLSDDVVEQTLKISDDEEVNLIE